MTEIYKSGSGQNMVVHMAENCKGEHCTIHNPSMDWPTHWRDDLGMMEYTCPCGVGYPAPEDQKAYGHAYGACGNVKCMKEYRLARDKVNGVIGPQHYYDCDQCKFNWCCSLGCVCMLVHSVTLPDPPQNVIDSINKARHLRGGSPYNPETGI